MSQKLNGKVGWFDEKKGFGIIKYQDKEYFAHHSEIKINKDVYKALQQNEDVEFEHSYNEVKKKLVAKNISGVNGNKLNCENNNQIHKPKQKNKRKAKNTQSFDPDLTEPDIRLLIDTNKEKFTMEMKENDVVILPNHFENPKEGSTVYQSLLNEMENCGVPPEELWKLWHGDTHFIADDRLAKKMGFDWKEKCPTFNMVIETMKKFFDMDVKATRFNLYKDNTEWKPYHHDAAAIDEKKSKTQNFTVGITFGATRTVSFQHAKSKNRLDIPLFDGSVYTFARKVNIEWMHGIVQEAEIKKEGRISIILWGKNSQIESSNIIV